MSTPFSFAFLLAGALATTSCSALDSKSCTAIGCQSTVSLEKKTVRFDPAAVSRLAVRVCHNGECMTDKLVADETTDGGFRCTSRVVAPSGQLTCSLRRQPTNETGARPFEVTASFAVFGSEPPADGDRFRFEILDGTAHLFDSGEQSVAFQTFHPNGADCDPGCKNGSL